MGIIGDAIIWFTYWTISWVVVMCSMRKCHKVWWCFHPCRLDLQSRITYVIGSLLLLLVTLYCEGLSIPFVTITSSSNLSLVIHTLAKGWFALWTMKLGHGRGLFSMARVHGPTSMVRLLKKLVLKALDPSLGVNRMWTKKNDHAPKSECADFF